MACLKYFAKFIMFATLSSFTHCLHHLRLIRNQFLLQQCQYLPSDTAKPFGQFLGNKAQWNSYLAKEKFADVIRDNFMFSKNGLHNLPGAPIKRAKVFLYLKFEINRTNMILRLAYLIYI